MNDAVLENPVVRIDSEVTRRVRQHARAHMQTEVCGVLIGNSSSGVIEIEAPIEAFNASQAGAHVTFTQAAWETIYRVKDKDFPLDRIVGWYHSHPGFGVFLSDHDTFIHRNFFSSPDQVAWVYDPHSDEEGCFAWVDGSIHRLASIHVADSNGERPQRAGQPLQSGETMQASRTGPPEQPEPRFSSPAQPGWVRYLCRWTGIATKLLAGFVAASRALLVLIAPTGERQLQSEPALSASGVPGLTETAHPAVDAQMSNATEPLLPESRL